MTESVHEILNQMPLHSLGKLCHENAERKGFYDDIKLIEELHAKGVLDPDEAINLRRRLEAVRFALIMTEAIEAMEGHRCGDFSNEAEELADVQIRLAEFAYYRNIDLDEAVEKKVMKNHGRPHMHGGKSY